MAIKYIPQIMAKTGECIDSYDNKADFLIAVARMEKAIKRQNITRELAYTIVPIGNKNMWQIFLMP